MTVPASGAPLAGFNWAIFLLNGDSDGSRCLVNDFERRRLAFLPLLLRRSRRDDEREPDDEKRLDDDDDELLELLELAPRLLRRERRDLRVSPSSWPALWIGANVRTFRFRIMFGNIR